ncbi:hypothetical protein M0811_11502 [Anaeramoeba ignava]|uniref:F-box domain-containing protein n=1 Tax=Anaeramoeba ignava TaxID=1746090 RepID=A0A9Q0LDE5_ANAIG|nr:hypothetical protein M0811_11502 [Anaeramoeba ignava]
MESFQIINYKSNPAIKIEREHLNQLKKGSYCEFGESLKLIPKEENLIIEMLPEEILLYIFQFLSPGELIRIASTCKTFNQLSEDKNTWRNISYNYNQFFIFDQIELEKNNYVYQEDQIPIYGTIKENQPKNENQNENENSSFVDSKTKSSLKALLLRRDQNQNQIENDEDILFENEIKNNLIEHIEKTSNPKQELVSKANLVYNGMKKRKELIDENLKRKEENDKKAKKIQKIDKVSFVNLLFLLIGFIAFLIALNVHIEKKLSSNTIYVFIPILLPILIFIILFFYLSKIETYLFSIYGIGMIMLFIQLLLIGLRSDSTIKGSWLLIFIPFFILIGILIIMLIVFYFIEDHKFINTFPSFNFIMIFLFLIFLGLRLDDEIKWNYGIVFIPLFLINLFPFWISTSFLGGLTLDEHGEFIFGAFLFLFSLISIPILIIETFIVLFLEVPKFNNITYAFIPLYLFLGLLLCFLSILGFFKIFR